MQMKILGAVALATGLVLAGCSGGGNSSSSGSTGTTTSGTTGQTSSGNTSGNTTSGTTGNTNSGTTTGNTTSGTTTGGTTTGSTTGSTTGTTGSLCSPACTASGESCNSYKNPFTGQTSHSCGCVPANRASGVADSCAANTDGNIVCDQLTLHCRAGRDYDTANEVGVYPDGGGNPECDSQNGYVAVNFCYTTITNGNCANFPDGGSGNVPTCVQLCLGASDCSAYDFACRTDNPFTEPDGGPVMIPVDGGSAPLSFCDINICGPTAADDGGLLNSDYFGTCNAHGTGDGTCLPLGFGSTGQLGVCSATNADAGVLGYCDPDYLAGWSANGCGAESYCTGSGDGPGKTGVCLQMCNANTSSGVYQLGCPSVGSTQLTCSAFSATFTLADGGLEPGACQ